MRIHYQAEAELEDDQTHEFDGHFDGDVNGGYRPLFAKAREMAVAAAGEYGHEPDSITVTAISYVSD